MYVWGQRSISWNHSSMTDAQYTGHRQDTRLDAGKMLKMPKYRDMNTGTCKLVVDTHNNKCLDEVKNSLFLCTWVLSNVFIQTDAY